MKEFIEIGKVCKLNDILFVQYRTSPVLTEINTFYLNQQNGKSTNLFTPSITQWHWNPISEEEESKLKDIVTSTKEYISVTNQDMWLKEKMTDVMKIVQ